MEKFRRRHAELPANLYRVQYPGCQTALSGNGLQAKETNVTYTEDDMNAFRESIIKQLTWGHRGDQPYITCFSEKDHAENWACKEPWNHSEYGNESWSLLTIDTELMPESYVFSLKDLVTQLDLALPEMASQHVKGGYLCLHRIPTTAIVYSASAREVKNEVEDRKWQETYHPLDDYSGSDLEAAENNWNDDIMKMVEGDWN